MICPFCLKLEAGMNIDGVPICKNCVVIFGSKLSNVKIMAKIAKIELELKEMNRKLDRILSRGEDDATGD